MVYVEIEVHYDNKVEVLMTVLFILFVCFYPF